MLHRDESRHDFAFIAGVIIGAIAGALATLALTPMSGPETRAKLRERTGDLGPVKERAATVAGSAQQFVASGRERASELAAKAPLPMPGRASDEAAGMREADARAGAEVETDTMTDERNMGSAAARMSNSGESPHSVHPQQPAEGRDDIPPEGAGQDGAQRSAEETGSGRTPHPSEPAEGRNDVPPPDDKEPSGSGS